MAYPIIRTSERNKSFSMYMGEKKLIMHHGDVAALDADVLVCPVDQNLDFRSGVAKAISSAAGKELKTHRPLFPEPLGKVVVLPGGKMKVKYIFMTVLLGEKEPAKMKFAIREAVNRTIRYAEFLRLKSIAFPVLGNPRTAPPYNMIAKEMLEDVTKYFQRRNTKIKLILFSVFNADAYSAFCKEARHIADL
jgi:O-acetyl-ADP-ribose deacetylase (regulator of RNase III)